MEVDIDNLPKASKPGDTAKPTPGIAIVGYNLLGLVLYTLMLKLAGSGGFFLDAFILFFHVLVCIIMAASLRSWPWLLSALLVLIVGFSTCYMLGT